MAGATVCIKALRGPLIAAAARTGRPLPELAKLAGIEVAMLGDASARVPHALAVRVWDAMAELAGAPGFGVFVAQLIGAVPFDLVDLALFQAPDLRAMATLFGRYQTLFHDANDVAITETATTFEMTHRFRGELPSSRYLIEFILANWLLRARRAAGQPFAAVEVRVRATETSAEARALFGRVVTGAPDNTLVLPIAAVALPITAADPALRTTLLAQLEHDLRRAGGDVHTLDEVRAGVRAELLGGEPTIARVARALAMSDRTLQRRLREAGSSFRAVLDDARREIAIAQLRGGRTTATDVAFLLGFADLSAFSRAFRRWTGASPATYRAS